MVHAGEYNEPLSYTARFDGKFRVDDMPRIRGASKPQACRRDRKREVRILWGQILLIGWENGQK
jgi:hypothetical protein